jgi:hypothetical protein
MLTVRIRLIAVGLSGVLAAGAMVAATAPASGGADRAPALVGVAVPRLITAHRARAIRAAQAMLADAVLPNGSMVSAPQLTGRGQALARPISMIFVADQVDVHRFWTTSATSVDVLSSIAAHLPTRARQQGAGYGGDESFTTFVFPKVASPTIAARQLAVTTVRSDDRTVVRVDAEVEFRAPRLPRQDVPPTARALDVVKTGARHPGHSAHPKIRTELARTITRPALVRRIAALANALPLSGNDRGIAFSCPALLVGSPVDTFRFRARAGSPPLAVVTIAADAPATIDPCANETLKLGQRTLGLEDGGLLLERAAAILHLKLAT